MPAGEDIGRHENKTMPPQDAKPAAASLRDFGPHPGVALCLWISLARPLCP
jgi:hypothetical protein